MRFRFSSHGTLLRSLWLGAAIEGLIESLREKSCAHTPDRGFPYLKGVHDLLIAPALLAFEQDLGVLDLAGRCLTVPGQRF